MSSEPEKIADGLFGHLRFGVRPELPVRNFPKGRIRIRQRNNAYPVAFVKTETGIRRFLVSEHEGHWIPFVEQSANHRPNSGGVE